MKKKASFLLIFILLFAFPLHAQAAWPAEIPGNEASTSSEDPIPDDGPSLTGSNAIIMDIDTGDVLYQLNPHEKVYPASTTKLMTALLLVENMAPADTITVTDGIYSNLIEDAVKIGLIPGEEISAKDMLYGMLLPSANDAANAIAEGVGGSIPDFVTMMNNTAADLGCTNTHFANANGLHDDNHYTTPYDMVLIARAAYDRSRIREVIKTPSYWMAATNLSGQRELWTTNELLYDVTDLYYPDCTGGKTGYTGEAGYTMVAFAEKDHRRIVAAVFGCPTSTDRFRDAAALLDYGLKEYHILRPLQDFSIDTEPDTTGTLDQNYYSTLDHPLPSYSFDTSLRFYTRSSVSSDDIVKNVQLSGTIRDGVAGKIVLSYKGKTLGEVPVQIDEALLAQDRNSMTLVPDDSSSETQNTGEEKGKILGDTLRTYGPGILIAIGVVVLVLLLLLLLKKTQEKKRVRVRRYMGDRSPSSDRTRAREQDERLVRRERREGSRPGGTQRPPMRERPGYRGEQRPGKPQDGNIRRREDTRRNDENRSQTRDGASISNRPRQSSRTGQSSNPRQSGNARQGGNPRQNGNARQGGNPRQNGNARQGGNPRQSSHTQHGSNPHHYSNPR